MATHPGINPKFEFGGFNMDERHAIRILSEEFYVTRAATLVRLGNSEYRSFLMRPTDEVSAFLNVEREIIVLFADYEAFEARTLKAFDKVAEEFDDIRIDKSIRFIVSRDITIEQKIQLFLQQDPEYPVVVPFTFQDFKRGDKNLVYNRVRKNYLVRDLFGYQSPLKQDYFFFGRTKLVESVVDRHRSGQNSGIFGLRKSGKTSSIYAIQRRAKASDFRTLLVDCQDPAVHAKRYSDLLGYIIAQARAACSLKPIEAKLGTKPDEISELFRSSMNQTLGEAKSDMLLIFDEIENISPRTAASEHWRKDRDSLLFWGTLRSYFQAEKKRRLTFCFVGTNPHLFEMPKLLDVDNPIYMFASKTFIPMLPLAEVSNMIKKLGFFMGLDFPDGVISHIHSRYGGHPFFTRQLCSQIHQEAPANRPFEVSKSACTKAEFAAANSMRIYMNEVLSTLKKFYPEEYEMLEYLAKGETKKFNEMAGYSSEFLEHLLGYGIIVKRGNDFELSFDAVADVVKAATLGSAIETLEEKWKKISVRRNKLEVEVRSALYHWAFQLDKATWQEAKEKSLSRKRLEELSDLNVREAFSKNSSPLYFLELMKFVEFSNKYDTDFIPISNILHSSQIVNSFRSDAHAKGISDDDYAKLGKAFDLLESVFLPPE